MSLLDERVRPVRRTGTTEPAAAVEQPAAEKPRGIETHSIDWVPDSERRGRVAHLGAVWFVGNINLTAMATGVAALSIWGEPVLAAGRDRRRLPVRHLLHRLPLGSRPAPSTPARSRWRRP